VLTEPDKRALRFRGVKCPNCNGRILFRSARFPHIDEQGFESYAFNCDFCRSGLVGVIDPYDGELLLSIAADKGEGGAALTRWRQARPLAGLALAAAVNAVWVGLLAYMLVKVL
jgi:hypothetical protein